MYNEENIILLRENLVNFTVLIDDFVISMRNESRELNVAEKYFHTYLFRVRYDIEGVIGMLNSYILSPMLILPIAQVMRSLLTDFITSFYLFSFYDRNDDSHQSFENELKLIDRDAFRSVLEWMNVEEELHKFNENLPSISEEDKERRVQSIQNFFSEILDNDFKPLSTINLREGSLRKFFFENDELSEPRRIVSESYKIRRLKKMKWFRMLDGYMLYKFFSQFYHESKLFNLLVSEGSKNSNFDQLVWGFIPVYHMVDNAFRIFLRGNNDFSNQLGNLKLDLEAIFNRDES